MEKYREKLVDKAMFLWDACHENYNNEIKEYLVLLEKKREMRIAPINPISKNVLRQYPEIPFLGDFGDDRYAAAEFLDSLTNDELQGVIVDVQILYIEGYTHRTIRSWIIDAKAQILKKETRAHSGLFMSPDVRTMNGSYRGRRNDGRGRGDA